MSFASFVYALADATGVRYIGGTTGKPQIRYRQHMCGYGSMVTRDWIRATNASGGAIRLLILEACDGGWDDSHPMSLRNREAAWMAALYERGVLLLNKVYAPWHNPNR